MVAKSLLSANAFSPCDDQNHAEVRKQTGYVATLVGLLTKSNPNALPAAA